jgi:hypothetical protein
MCCTGLCTVLVYVLCPFVCCTGLCAVPVYVLCRFVCCAALYVVPVYVLYRFVCCIGLCAVPVYCCTGLCAVPIYVLCRFMCCAGLCAVPVYVLYWFVCCPGLCAVPVCVLYQDLLLSFRVRTTLRLITPCPMLISDLLTCGNTLRLLGVHYKVQRISFFTVVPCILILSKFFIHQLMHKWIVFKTILKFALKLTLKQLRHVSLQSHHHQGAHYSCLRKLQLLK